MGLVDSGLINKNYASKVVFLSRRVIVIKLNKDIYKGEIAVFNLVISIRVISKNNYL